MSMGYWLLTSEAARDGARRRSSETLASESTLLEAHSCPSLLGDLLVSESTLLWTHLYPRRSEMDCARPVTEASESLEHGLGVGQPGALSRRAYCRPCGWAA